MPNGQPYCFPEFGDSPMLQHVTTCCNMLVIIDCFHESALLLTFIDHLRLRRRGNAVAKPTHHPEVILGSCR